MFGAWWERTNYFRINPGLPYTYQTFRIPEGRFTGPTVLPVTVAYLHVVFFTFFNQRHFQLLLVTMAVLGKMRLIRATTLLFFVSLMIGMMGGSFAHGQEVSLKLGYAV